MSEPMELPDNRLLVRVYGDSLSLPRTKDGIPFFATYPELLRQEYERICPGIRVHLYNRARSAGTVSMLYADYDKDTLFFGNSGNDILIIQCGVCDCAPRPIPPWLRKRIDTLPGRVKNRIVNFLHNNRSRILRSGLVWQETNPDMFRDLYTRWLNSTVRKFRSVYAVNIAPTTDRIEAHSPGFSTRIQKYNRLIAEVVQSVEAKNLFLIDVYETIRCEPDGIQTYILAEDGHHITVAGHKLYSRLILEHERRVILERGVSERMKEAPYS